MRKLNDTQLVVLAGAAQRDDQLVDCRAKPMTAAQRKSIANAITLGLLDEVPVARGQPVWRTEPDGKNLGLQITTAGLNAIGIEDAGGEVNAASPGQPATPEQTSAPAALVAGAGSKLMAVVDLLRREGGASLDEIIAVTNWLPHSARAALTGLRKRGHHVERFTGSAKGSSYRIVSSPAPAGSEMGDQP